MSNITVFFTTFVPVLSTILTIFLTLGGLFALRKGYFKQLGENSKQASEIQEKIIIAQKEQIEMLEKRLDACEKEITHLREMFATATEALMQQKGIILSVSGDIVTIQDGNRSNSVRKRPRPAPKKESS